MEVKEIRKLNARYWMDTVGRGALAEKMGYKDTVYLNQLYIGATNIGGRTARKLETALDLNRGWMDSPHPDLWSADPGHPSSAELRQAFSRLLDELSPEGLEYAYQKVKRIVEQDSPLPEKPEPPASPVQ